MAVIELAFSSRLAAPVEAVWSVVSTMDGVNAELHPWMHMTVPRGARGANIADAPLGEVAFTSCVLAMGVVPIDLHRLRLLSVDAPHGFVEDSTTLLQARWEHRRSLAPDGDRGCIVRDELRFSPRVALAAPLVRAIIRGVFDHRHRRLRARFGSA